MNILITGAGRLSLELGSLLKEKHSVHLFDSRKIRSPFLLLRGDIRREKDVFSAVAGMDAVIHTAGIYGLHFATHDFFEFHDVNVRGTLNILEAMARRRVEKLVLASSAAVYGWSKKESFIVDENTPCRPDNFYGLTKLLAEQMCRFYAEKYDFFKCTCLRYSAFYELPKARQGPALLYDAMDKTDAACATALALENLRNKFSVYLVSARVPFRAEDASPLKRDPMWVLERYYPGATELIRKYHLDIPAIEAVYDIGKAQKEIQYEPQYDFARFLDELRQHGLAPSDYDVPREPFRERIQSRLKKVGKQLKERRLS